MLRIFAFLMLSPLPAQAQEVVFDPATIEQCLIGGGWTECVGQAANACMEQSENGYSTLIMVACLAEETDWWDRDLNATYRLILARDAALDANPDPDGMAPAMGSAIRDVQRAWIAFREASCHYEMLRWQGGTGARLAGAGCTLQMTGEQALRLRSYLAEG